MEFKEILRFGDELLLRKTSQRPTMRYSERNTTGD
jgi:hypothetical protein